MLFLTNILHEVGAYGCYARNVWRRRPVRALQCALSNKLRSRHRLVGGSVQGAQITKLTGS